VALTLFNLFDLRLWRAATAGMKALLAYDNGRYPDAFSHWSRVVEHERMRTPDFMAFLAVLMVMNKRPAKQGLAMFRRVAAGEFHRDTSDARYAEALAGYWAAFLENRTDVEERWSEACKLAPIKGWVARHLPLPTNPLDPAGCRSSDFSMSDLRAARTDSNTH